MAKYSLSQAADADLARLYVFGFRSFGEKLADQYYDGLLARLQQIADMPSLYPVSNISGNTYRRSVYGSHSIYYTLTNETVLIVRILGREDPKSAL